MKFVGLIQKYDIINHELIVNIPHYHRSSMGLFSKTAVYAVPRYYKGSTGTSEKATYREIILTPFDPKSWGDLWKIEMTTKEFPGVVNLITKFIANEQINILVQESLTTEQNKTHAITIIANMVDYTGDSNHSARIDIKEFGNENLDNLKAKLEGIENEKKELITQSISIKRMEFLANNSLRAEDVSQIYRNEDFLINPEFSLIDNRQTKLPGRIAKYLKINEEQTSINASIFSDTEEKYLIVYLFDKTQDSIAIDVVHGDALGAINAFTGKIIDVDKRINILNCFNRIESMSKISHWNAILDITHCSRKLEELLSGLKNCEYNSYNKVKQVWLTDWINDPEDSLIIKYGQIKWKNENELNYVGQKKKKLIIDACREKKIQLKKENEQIIIKELEMQGSEEEKKLISLIVREENARKGLIWKKVGPIVYSFIATMALLIMMILFRGENPVKKAEEQLSNIGHYLYPCLSLVVFIAFFYIFHKSLDKSKSIIAKSFKKDDA